MKKITIKDVAERAGVSITTASFAINNVTERVNAQTQARVLMAANELGYVPNIYASKLRRNVSDAIMLVYSQVFLEELNANTEQFILGTLKYAKKFKKDIILQTFYPYDDWDKMIQKYSEIWMSRKVDGIIFLCAVDDNVPDYVFSKLYNEYDVNLVNATSPSQLSSQKDYPCIHEDLYYATYHALEHIVEIGYKEIFFVGMNYKTFYPLRFQAYLNFIKDKNIPGKLLEYNSIYRTKDDIWALLKPIIENQNQDIAFMCWDDLDAISILELLHTNETNSNYRIGVIGYDDIPTAAHTIPPLTTIRNPYDEISRLCVKTICEQINGRLPDVPNIIVDAEFIERKSL